MYNKKENAPLKLDEFKNTTTIVYAKPPPKSKGHPPLNRQNSSGVLEYLKQLIVGIRNKTVAQNGKPNSKVNDKIIGMYAGDINKNDNFI